MAAKGLFPYSLGGLEKTTAFMANALVDEGAYVEVLAPIGRPLVTGFEAKYREINIEWPSVKPHKLAYYIYSKRVRDYILNSDFDVAYGQGSSLWSYVDVKKMPCIYNPHGMEEYKDLHILRRIEKPLQLLFNRKIARKSDAVISLGGNLTIEVIRFLNVPANKVRVIPNAVDLKHVDGFRPHKLNRKNNSFLFVGKVAYNKGIIDLVGAFKKLRLDVELNIAGTGPLLEKLRQDNHDLRINFLGRVNEDKLFELYWNSDAFIYPTLFEGMPTVVIEAMACGLPVISTDIGGLPDLVDQRNGFVIPPASPEVLARTVERFAALSEEDKDKMRASSRQKVESKFTWKKVAKQTLSLIRDLL